MADPTLPNFSDTVSMLANAQASKSRRDREARAIAERPGVIRGGLSAGVDNLQEMFGSGVQGIGVLTGSDYLRDTGRGIAERNRLEAAQNGRPDLEGLPTDFKSFFPTLAYQIAKQGPLIAGTLLTGGVGGAAGGAIKAAQIGSKAAKTLQGANAVANASKVGNLAGGLGFTSGTGFGAMVGSAQDRATATGGEVTKGDVLQAAALSPAYGIAERALPASLGGIARGTGFGGTAARTALGRAAKATGGGFATEAATEAFQSGLEQTFRTDLSMREKTQNVVEAAIMGGMVGGGLGGGTSVAGSAFRKITGSSDTKAMTEAIDQQMQELQGGPAEATVATDADGNQLALPAPQQAQPTTPAQVRQEAVQAVEPRILQGAATPQDLAVLDATLQQEAAEASATGRPTDVMLRTQMVNQQAIEQTQKNLARLAGNANQLTKSMEARTVAEAGSQIIDRLEANEASQPLLNLAEKMGIIDAQGRTIEERNIPAEREAIAARVSAEQRNMDVAPTKEQKKAAKARRESAKQDMAKLNASVQLRERIEEYRTADPAALAAEVLNVQPAAQTPAAPTPLDTVAQETLPLDGSVQNGAPVAPQASSFLPREGASPGVTPDTITSETYENPAPTSAGPVNPAPSALAEQLAPFAAQLDQSGTRAAEFDAATAQADAQRRQQAVDRVEAEAEWNRRAGDGKTLFEQLTVPAQQQWTQAVASGTANQQTFEKLRPSRRPVPATQELQGNQISVLEDRTQEPTFKRKSPDSKIYDVTLPSGRQTEMVYVAGKDRGWYVKGSEGTAEGFIIQKGSAKQAATALRDRAADAPLPAGASLNPTNGTRFFDSGGRVVEASVNVTDVTEDIARVFGERSDVNVVNTLADLPQDVLEDLATAIAPQIIKGFVMEDGRVFLVAENIESRQEAVAIANHEILGHKGLEKLFRQRLDAAMVEMYNTNPGIKAKTELWIEKNPGAYADNRNPTARAVEEVLAHMSETGLIELSTWDNLVRIVKDLLRRAGVKMTMTDREITATLARAHELAMGAAKQTKVKGTRYMYAGEQAVSINKKQTRETRRVDSMRREARAMERRGADNEDIRLATGWFRGETDGKWRYEIADRSATLIGETPQSTDGTPKALNQVLSHPRLFEFYPELSTVSVVYENTSPGSGGYAEGIRRITLSMNSDPEQQFLTVLHETQHALQGIEGFARGQSMKPEGILQLSLANLKRVVPKLQRVEQDANSKLRDAGRIAQALKMSPRGDQILSTLVGPTAQDGQATAAQEQARADATVVANAAGVAAGHGAWRSFMNSTRDATSVKNLDAVLSDKITKSDKTLDQIAELASKLKNPLDAADVRPIVTKLSKNGRMRRAAYDASAGELESQDIELRLKLTPEQKRRTSPLALARDAVNVRVGEETVEGRGGGDVLRASTADIDDAMDKAVGFASKLATKAKEIARNAGPNLRKFGLYLSDLKHIQEYWGAVFPTDPLTGTNAVDRLVDSFRTRSTTAARMSTMMLAPYHQFERLDKADQAVIGDLMSKSQYGIDPRKAPRDQPHLKLIKNKSDREFVMAEARKAHQVYTNLKKRGKAQVYDDLVAANEAQIAAQNSMAMYNTLRTNEEIASELLKDMKRSPMERFVQSKAQLHLDTQQARDFWVNEQDTMLKKTERMVEQQRGSMQTLKAAEAQEQADKLAPVEQALRDVRRNKQEVIAPYFHLGRFGEYFVSFNVKADPENATSADRAHLKALTDKLEKKGFNDIRITTPIGGRNVFIRLESEAQTQDLFVAMKELEDAGAIEKVTQGDRRQGDGDGPRDMEKWANELTSFVNSRFRDTEGMNKKEAKNFRNTGKQFEALIRDYTMNKLPDTSNSKVMLHRRNVPGFSPDMVRSYAFRSEIAAKSLANISAAPQVTEAFTNMKAEVKKSRTKAGDKVFQQQDVLNELVIRENDRGVTEEYSPWDSVRAANHVYFLGMSPAYFLTNVTQVYALLLPELGKKHGFVKSMNSVNRNTGRAFKILQASLAEAKASGGGFRAMVDLQITAESLVRAGLEQKEADFFMRVLNSGVIDIGSASREIGRISEGSNNAKLDTAFRAGSVMGLYSEVVTRSAAALAVYELASTEEKSSEAGLYGLSRKASAMIDETMLNYSPWAIGRFSGKKGQAGAITPVLLSFMQYTFQLTSKLYRETYAAFKADPNRTEEENAQIKKEARRFLRGHAAMITTLAGSLGLPTATVLAEVFNQIGDLFDDEEEQPTDVITAYRNFLSDTFGVPIGEVLARGVPRAIGFDLSRRAGEQDIIPFSRLIADSRTFDESFKEAGARALGSPFSALTNIFAGAEQIANGNIYKGIETAVPIAAKGVMKGFKMTQDGYTDNAGNVLPMSVGAKDIMFQIFGFSPAEKAEYSEASYADTRRKSQLARRAQDIRRNLAVAIEQGDRAAAREWMATARAFDRQNPAFDILPGVGRTLMQRQRASAISSATDTPIGVDFRDPTAVAQGRFANF